MKRKLSSRILSALLVCAMLAGMVAPAAADSKTSANGLNGNTAKIEKAEGAPSFAKYGGVSEKESTAPYADNENVRVSIVLEEAATIERYSADGIASNSAAKAYRSELKAKQDAMSATISEKILDGEELDVAWNLTLAANIISANVEFGKIDAIKKLPGVKDVFVEIRYEPMVVNKDIPADPDMGTSSAQIGSTTAWAEGYTGAGSRIAVVDTGIDTDHQSFSAEGYDYSLKMNAEAKGMTVDEYVASLDLLDAEEIAGVLDQLNAAKRYNGLTANDLYLTTKIPYAFNYVDSGLDVTHDNDTQGEHGSHVEGIAAANAYIPAEDGTFTPALDSVKMQGVAPDAQIITMKVFGVKGGAYDSDYMAAIEDAIVLGCDSVNLSLGSGNPGMSYSLSYQNVMDNLANSGIVATMSAGNAGYWAENLAYKDAIPYLFSDDVSMQMDGSPGSYTNTMATASVDNVGTTGTYFAVGDMNVIYTETTGYSNKPMTTIAGEQEYIMINKPGTDADVAALGDLVKGKVLFVNRGSTSFFEKGNAGAKAGAIAVIICNNQAGVINMNLEGYNYTAPCVSILQSEGEYIRSISELKTTEDGTEYYTGTMTVSAGVASSITEVENYTMSDFSSWGVPGSLQLKPEITAPGGNIYSVNGAVAGGQAYENMSGTSMAAPQMSGMVAVVAQYIRENGLAEEGVESRRLAQKLLMSTAVPVIEDFGNGSTGYYPVLRQGAGLANVGAAIKANTVITMDESATKSAEDGKIKAELGDDPEKNGEYKVKFTVENMTDTTQFVNLSAEMFTQDVFPYGDYEYLDTFTTPLEADTKFTVNDEEVKPVEVTEKPETIEADVNGDGYTSKTDAKMIADYLAGNIEKCTNMDAADVDGDGDITTYDAYLILKSVTAQQVLANVSIPANSSVEVVATIALTDAEKANLDANYPAGAYVEGYIFVSAVADEEGVLASDHSIPVLGFYGNWSDASMFDNGTYAEAKHGIEPDEPNYMGYTYSNAFLSEYGNEPGKQYYIGGNPCLKNGDSVYAPERDAISFGTGSKFAAAEYTLIRNAAAYCVIVKDVKTGEIVYQSEPTTGVFNSAYYYVNGGAWQYKYATTDFTYDGEGTVNNGRYEIGFVMIPEYYVDYANNKVDVAALGEGAAFTQEFTVDNDAPVINSIEAVDTDNDGVEDAISIDFIDNQYVCAILLYESDGKSIGGISADQMKQTAGEKTVFRITGLEDFEDVLTVEVHDYADNVATGRVFLNVEPAKDVENVEISAESLKMYVGTTKTLTAIDNPFNLLDRSVKWTSSDESVATVKNGVVTGVDAGTATITAASVTDPTKTATCEVTVENIDVIILGALQDKEGKPMTFGWDFNTDKTWTKLNDIDTTINATAYDFIGDVLYVQNADSIMYAIDVDDGSTISTYSSYFTDLAVFDFDFAYCSRADGALMPIGIYGGWVIDEELSGWNLTTALSIYTGASKFVGISWAGQYSDGRDIFYALDNAGVVWMLIPDFDAGRLSYARIPTDIDLAFPMNGENQFCSLVCDAQTSDIMYLSYFTGKTNEIYLLEYDVATKSFVSTKIGEVGADVWPASIFFGIKDSNSAANTYSLNEVETATITRNAVETVVNMETVQATKLAVEDLKAAEKVAAGSLNATSAPVNGKAVSHDETTVTVTITYDEDTITNGLFDVKSYDKSQLEFVDAKSSATIFSYNVTTDANDANIGKIKIAVADLKAFKPGEAIATITFKTVGTRYVDSKVVVDTLDLGVVNSDGETANVDKEILDKKADKIIYISGSQVVSKACANGKHSPIVINNYKGISNGTVICSECGEVLAEASKLPAYNPHTAPYYNGEMRKDPPNPPRTRVPAETPAN